MAKPLNELKDYLLGQRDYAELESLDLRFITKIEMVLEYYRFDSYYAEQMADELIDLMRPTGYKISNWLGELTGFLRQICWTESDINYIKDVTGRSRRLFAPPPLSELDVYRHIIEAFPQVTIFNFGAVNYEQLTKRIFFENFPVYSVDELKTLCEDVKDQLRRASIEFNRLTPRQWSILQMSICPVLYINECDLERRFNDMVQDISMIKYLMKPNAYVGDQSIEFYLLMITSGADFAQTRVQILQKRDAVESQSYSLPSDPTVLAALEKTLTYILRILRLSWNYEADDYDDFVRYGTYMVYIEDQTNPDLKLDLNLKECREITINYFNTTRHSIPADGVVEFE